MLLGISAFSKLLCFQKDELQFVYKMGTEEELPLIKLSTYYNSCSCSILPGIGVKTAESVVRGELKVVGAANRII